MSLGTLLKSSQGSTPTAPTPTPQASGLSHLLTQAQPISSNQQKIQQYTTEESQAKATATKANSPLELAKQTVLGIPKVVGDEAKSIAKGAVEFGLSAGEAPARILNPKLAGVALPPQKVPGLGALGPVQSFESKAAQDVQQGVSPIKAVGGAAFDTVVNDPIGIAFKPIILGLGIAGKAFAPFLKTLSKSKSIPEVTDLLSKTGIPKKAIPELAPKLAAASTPHEVEQVLKTTPQPERGGLDSLLQESAAPHIPAQTPSAMAKSVEAKGIESGLVEKFDGLAGYTPKKVADEAAKVANLITTDVEKARSIIRGETELPSEISGSMLVKGLEDYANKTKDPSLLRELAQSPIAGENSVHAQELRLSAERDPNSTVSALKDVIKTRETAAGSRIKSLPKAKAEVTQSIKQEIQKQATPKTWNDFVDSITC